MTPTQRGMFCSNCKKEVYDFTTLSDYELIRTLDNEDKICGKLKSQQLYKEMNYPKSNTVSKIGFLLGLATIFSIAAPVFSQKITNKIQLTDNHQGSSFKKKKMQTTSNDSINIRGQVFGEEGPLSKVNVQLKGTSHDVFTDFDGFFSIHIHTRSFKNNKPTLVFSYVGMDTQEVLIHKKTEFLKINMAYYTEYMVGEIVLIKKQNIFRRIGNLFRKKENRTHY